MVRKGVKVAMIALTLSSLVDSWRCTRTAFKSKVTPVFQLPPRTGGGQGEWADWDTDNYLEDEYVDEDDETPSAIDPALLSLAQKTTTINDEAIQADPVSTTAQPQGTTPADWDRPDAYSRRKPSEFGDASLMREPWSEEAPYFDEADVQDDEGNWGRDSSMQFGGAAKGSSLWMSRTEYAAVAEELALTPAATHAQPSSSRSSSSSSYEAPAAVQATPAVSPNHPPSEDIINRIEQPNAIESRVAKLEQSISDLTVSLAWVKGFGAGIVFMLIAFKAIE